MHAISTILSILGWITLLGGFLILLAEAYRISIVWLVSLIVPVILLFFIARHWAEARAGTLVAIAGISLIALGAYLEPNRIG